MLFPLFLSICFFLQYATANYADLANQNATDLFQGDIRLTHKNRNGIFASQRWPNGRIPYEFDMKYRGGLSQKQKDMVLKAMQEIEKYTCIKFVPKTNEKDYVQIFKGSACFCDVGKQGGIQYLSLSDVETNCWTHGIITHEILHAVGLWHEQSRADRDNYISINWNKVAPNQVHNFEKQASDTYGIDYNYWSIMHYNKYAFSIGGDQITITTKDHYIMERVMGWQQQAHELDYEKVRRIYECNSIFPEVPSPPGYNCDDAVNYCNAQKNLCGVEEWTWESCRKTCGFCKPDTCKDTYRLCWLKKNECNQAWAKDQCKKTCRYC